MHHISGSSGSSRFNYSTPLQNTKSRFAPVPANSPPPATPTSTAQASEGLQRPVAMPSMQAQLLRQLEVSSSDQPRQEGVGRSATTTFSTEKLKEMFTKAIEVQRRYINTQAGPSNNRYLEALNQLQQRGFQAELGKLNIRFTPYSLLGGARNAVENFREAIERLQQRVEVQKQTVNAIAAEAQNLDENDEAGIRDCERRYDEANALFNNIASTLKQAKRRFNERYPAGQYEISESESESETESETETETSSGSDRE